VFNFEETVEALIKITENLESGELSLEDSLKEFEKGIKLTRQAQKAIEEAEQSVRLLLNDSDAPNEPLLQKFDEEDESTK